MKIGILGSTGSIGNNTLEVIDNLKRQGLDIEVSFLSANNNFRTLLEQSKIYKPEYVFINNFTHSTEIQESFKSLNVKFIKNYNEFLNFIGNGDYDLLINSLVGTSGLLPTINAIKSGKRVALANKESMVIAGKLINELVRKYNSELIPIDSEHSAILQCLSGEEVSSVSKIILTASGGPFRGRKKSDLIKVTVEDALKHPNWKMGKKITIDSATMMNKGLEVIEARWLFNIDYSNIDILIHPQSIIHSLVEFKDGSIKAQLGAPDMRIPIQYAITYPKRLKGTFDKINFDILNVLDFEKPDYDVFKCLKLAFDALKSGGTYPVVLNAANEAAVNLFLEQKIGFLDISEIIEAELNNHNSSETYNIDEILAIDKEIKEKLRTKF